MKKVVIALIFSHSLFGKCDHDYILSNEKCKIPTIEPFNDEVTNIIKPQPYLSCSDVELATHVIKEDNSVVLHVSQNLLNQNTSKDLSCCYSYVTRNGSLEYPDVGFKTSECLYFENSTILTQDTVMVSCFKASKQIYANVHNAITINDSTRKKMKNPKSKSFSVLFIVIDSISRLNFIRTMPQTYEFLSENNFIEMKGYTKIADNTFPNFLGLLTGFSSKEIFQRCKAKEVGGMDACPMIWYDYSNEGYITAYAEDNTPISTFNYRKKGFTKPPTDYYFKPYMEAAEKLGVRYHNSMPYCAGPETAGERILNLARDFVTTFQNQSTFGIFWMNTFSHDDVNAPFTMDGKVKEFFADLKSQGVLEESVVIMLSDHGIRYGEIRTTKSGWFEERTPINMISVPRRFQEEFETEYQNLQNNSNKLTSTYDMFATLEHVLEMSGINYKRKGSSACGKCVSLFEEVPEERSCEDAGIPPEWCTCGGHFQSLNESSEYVERVASLAVDKYNLMGGPQRCKFLTLVRVVSASISEFLVEEKMRYIFVAFETIPSEIFLTTVKFDQVVSLKSTFYTRRMNNRDLCMEMVTRSRPT